MTAIPFFQVDAFARGPLTGNPAAVMPLERWLDDALLQAIAAENNLSETAFTVSAQNGDADYELRWFTPTTEVPLCGHATLAAGHALIRGERISFATRKSGVLHVTRNGDLLELDVPARLVESSELPGLAEALGAEGEMFEARGASTVIVLLESEQAVREVRPDFQALARFPELVIVTAPGDEQDIASRVFAVPVGIDEDPVTGAAHAALVPFWAERLGRERFSALQASKRSGLLDCRLAGDRVILGGRCATVIVGQFQL